ncbi:MAG: sigma-70 family RNA polymerase sigma factor [Candidatus Brocadiaceae bacterium]|jgi:RNA polymerase sigma-70 factor (ECF subfamily)
MGEAPPSDADLVRLARQGEDQAFGDLVERHQDYIYNAVFHLVGSEKDAEDLAQEVFVRAYEGLGSFEGRAKFTTWVYGIMLNTVRSFWRRQGRRDVVSLDLARDDPDSPTPEPPADGEGPVRMAIRQEQVSVVRAAIAELEDDLREILVLRDIQGFTYDEMAETLAVPQGTVKSRLHRARQRLKDSLEEFFLDAQ